MSNIVCFLKPLQWWKNVAKWKRKSYICGKYYTFLKMYKWSLICKNQGLCTNCFSVVHHASWIWEFILYNGCIIIKAASNSSTLLMEIYLLLEIPQAIAHLLTNMNSKKFNPPLFKSYLAEISLTSCLNVVLSPKIYRI
jgi:hypothetical protein